MATHEGGDTQGPPRRHAAGIPGGRAAPRVRDHGSAAGGQRRPVRPADRHHLPGPAPPGTGRPGPANLVAGWRAAAPRLRADPRRPACPGIRAGHLAAVLPPPHPPPRTPAAAGDIMTAPALPGRGTELLESYLAEVTARLPGPARAHAGIVAELRAGLLDAADAHRAAGLDPDTAAKAAISEFGDPHQVGDAFRPE